MRRAGFEVYLPLRREMHTWSDRKKWVDVPLLTSYIFAKIEPTQETAIRNVQGISHIVKFKGELAFIPEEEIQAMKDFLAAEVAIQVRETELLHNGVRVMIKEGALAGHKGMLISDFEDGNFVVHISGISMSMVMTIDADLLEPLPEEEQESEDRQKEYYIR